tara:strand:+ start:38 stop:715 length:678 start_codon:yes stop_codon:yes gene_type:complete
MGKVYVLRKDAATQSRAFTQPQVAVGSTGPSLLIGGGGSGNRPDVASFGPTQFDEDPESKTFGKPIKGTGEYGEQGSYQNRLARFGDKYGHLARYGLAGAGAINSFYNTTASGEPGALTAAATGAYTGWLGSGGAERGAANIGGKVGSRLDRRNTTGEQPIDAAMESLSPKIASPTGQPAPGPDVNNPITSNLAEPQGNITQGNPTKLEDFSNNNQYNMNDLRGY